MKIKLNKREYEVVAMCLSGSLSRVGLGPLFVSVNGGPPVDLKLPTRDEIMALGEKRFGFPKPPKPAKALDVGKLADKLADKSDKKIAKRVSKISDADRVKVHDQACSMMDDLNRTLGAYAGSKFSPEAEKRMRGLREIVVQLKILIAQKAVEAPAVKTEAKAAPKARAKAGSLVRNGKARHA